MADLLKRIGVVLALIVVSTVSAAQADDWVATRLRGAVFVFSNDVWAPLERGGTVASGQFLYADGNARAVLERDGQQITVGSSTHIMIEDRPGGGEFTTVYEQIGTVTVDVDARDVDYFAVRTRQLAAVVKGTRFTVRAGESASEVAVRRGVVNVQDPVGHRQVDVKSGQTASLAAEAAGEGLEVDGSGPIEPVLPLEGDVIPDLGALGNGNNGNGNGNNGNGNNGNGNNGNGNHSGGHGLGGLIPPIL
jgi:hypothetical protein